MEKRKQLVEDTFCVSIADLRDGSFLKQKGSLLLSVLDENMMINYESSGDVLYIEANGNEQSIAIEKRPALSGVAYFFICSCGQRCKKIYLPPGHEDFTCRHCCNLAYRCTRISDSTKNGAILNDYCRMLKLIEKGMSRLQAYKLVEAIALIVEHGTYQTTDGKTFKILVFENQEIRERISEEELNECFDYKFSTRYIDEIFARFEK